MAGLPWYKRDPGAFIDGCARGNLTLEEVGAYTLLVDEMYRRGGPLVDDPRHGCAYLRCDPRVWIRLRAALIRKGKIYATAGGLLSNSRVENELREQYDMREKRSRAARQSRSKTDYESVTEAQLRCNSSVTEGQLSPSNEHKLLKTNDTPSANAQQMPGRYRVRVDIPPTEVVGTVVPTPIDEPIEKALEEYNLAAIRAGWVQARLPISAKRRRHVRARLRDGGMAAWLDALGAAERQPFLAGDNGRGWRMDLDFFASEDGRIKILEGKYARGAAAKPIDWATALRIWDKSDQKFWDRDRYGPAPNELDYRGPADLFEATGGKP
jgi:uncharacterized protein YdaU (DUF1376 family)